MSQPLSIIIVEKMGNLKMLSIKDFKLDELYKTKSFISSSFKETTESRLFIFF